MQAHISEVTRQQQTEVRHRMHASGRKAALTANNPRENVTPELDNLRNLSDELSARMVAQLMASTTPPPPRPASPPQPPQPVPYYATAPVRGFRLVMIKSLPLSTGFSLSGCVAASLYVPSATEI